MLERQNREANQFVETLSWLVESATATHKQNLELATRIHEMNRLADQQRARHDAATGVLGIIWARIVRMVWPSRFSSNNTLAHDTVPVD